MKPYCLFFLALLIFSLSASAQDIASHQWEYRVLIVMSADRINSEFTRQVKELEDNQEGLTERKLKVYLATPEAYRQLSHVETAWIKGGDLYDVYNKKGAPLEVLLIGLDGQVKHHKDSFIFTNEIFKIIDSMPMRQVEIRNTKNKNKGK